MDGLRTSRRPLKRLGCSSSMAGARWSRRRASEIGRDPIGLARVSNATGVNIVMGASYYVNTHHPPGMDDLTEGRYRRPDRR